MIKINFHNGYCGCDHEEEFEGTYEEAIEFANEFLSVYAENMAHTAFGWDWATNEDITEEDMDEYLDNCGFDIIESEEDE